MLAVPPSAAATLALIGLHAGEDVRFRRAEGRRWEVGRVARVEPDGSITLFDPDGAVTGYDAPPPGAELPDYEPLRR